jgi:peptidoglycan/xylan/chitin deacetylase (PgdA/CDA1 family)
MARLPILMYHNVSNEEAKSFNLTISTQKLEEQLQYIVRHKFTPLFVSELENVTKIPSKSIVITFDDVTENQLLYALPLLKQYNVKATFFIPFYYIGKTDLWNSGDDASDEKIMTIEQLKSLDPNLIELGHHSYYHKKYVMLSDEEIQEDFESSYQVIAENDLKVYPSLAYPYGNYPKKGNHKQGFFELLQQNNIKMAFRIGNRVNRFPFKNRYEIQRIDIKGHKSLFQFKWKLCWGKMLLF